MKLKFQFLLFALSASAAGINAQQINDSNTPLHLMKPAYRVGYGVSTAESVKLTMDRVLRYIDSETPCDPELKQGGFRLTSYEWGVTYSGVLAAFDATGDEAYRDYVYTRHKLLAEMAPEYIKTLKQGGKISVNARRVVDPHALDDAGAVCCSMIKALCLRPQIRVCVNSSTIAFAIIQITS